MTIGATMDGGTMPISDRRPVREVRHLTLWSMCVWAYRDQRAHVYLKRPMDWFLWTLANEEVIEDGPRKTVHGDAATLHALVLDMPQRDAELIAFHAARETQPEPPMVMPEPFPTTPDRSSTEPLQRRTRWGQSEVHGKQEDYLIIITDEIVYEERPIWAHFGRKGVRQVGKRRVRVPVEYCPVTWLPDIAWVESEAAVHRDWFLAMNALYDRIDHSMFRDHAVVDFGIVPSYVEIEPVTVKDARTIEFDQQFPVREVEINARPNRIAPEDFSDPASRLLSTRLSASIKRA